MTRILKHTGIILASVLILLGVPLWCSGFLHLLFSGQLDAVSAATVVLDQPSGNYIIQINKALHSDEDKLNDWITFFSGGDILYIFEDISASVPAGDTGGMEMARSLQSRLPENQMKIYSEDATLLMSRADHGLYDIIIMSAEFAQQYKSDTSYNEDSVVIQVADNK